MDELINPMENIAKNVPSLTLQHYVLKKNGYNRHFFHRDFNVIKKKLIFCYGINILYCTLIKPVRKYSPYHVDRFEEKKLTQISNLSVKISRKTENILFWS